MRDKEARNLLDTLQKMKRVCGAIRKCFFVATIVSIIVWITVVAALLFGWLKSGQNMSNQVIYAVVFGALIVFVLWNLTKMFEEVDLGEQPFSEAQADRMQSIAIVAIAIAILDFLISVGFVFEPSPEIGFGMVANDGISEPTININFGMLAFSAIMYSLSAIFRYAALLQQLSDDTV